MKVARVLRASEFRDRPISAVVTARDFAARRCAEDILADVESRARDILARAEETAAELRGRAVAEGRAEGRAAVETELVRVHHARGELLGEAALRREAIRLALVIAERMLGEDIQRSPERIGQLCSAALEQIRGAAALVLRVHPGRATDLRAGLARIRAELGRAADVSVKEDATVDPDGCRIVSELGTLDVTVHGQTELLRRALLGESP